MDIKGHPPYCELVVCGFMCEYLFGVPVFNIQSSEMNCNPAYYRNVAGLTLKSTQLFATIFHFRRNLIKY